MNAPPPVGPPPLPAAPLAYATPLSMQPPAMAPAGVWREAELLVTPTTVHLPHACVKCNQSVPPGTAGSKRKTQKLAWHHPGLYALILAGVLLYAIVAICLQKKATVEFTLCPTHAAKRKKWIAFAWLSFLGGMGVVAISIVAGSAYAGRNDSWPVFLGLAGFFGGLILAVVGSSNARTFTPKRIDDRFAWLKGAGPEFLANFPAVQ